MIKRVWEELDLGPELYSVNDYAYSRRTHLLQIKDKNYRYT